MRRLLLALALICAAGSARATCILPHTFLPGTLANATKLMANFNALASCFVPPFPWTVGAPDYLFGLIKTTVTDITGSTAVFFGRNDYRVPGSNNPKAIYGDLWLNATGTYSGSNSAIVGNAYTIGQSPTAVTSVGAGGAGYAANDLVTLDGGTEALSGQRCSVNPVIRVSTVAGGAITAATLQTAGTCEVSPVNPLAQLSTTGGGSGATINLTVPAINATHLIGVYGRARQQSAGTITNADSLFADQCYFAQANTGLTRCNALYWNNGGQGLANNGLYVGGFSPTSVITGAAAINLPIVATGGGTIRLNTGNLATVTTDSPFAAGVGVQTCVAAMQGNSASALFGAITGVNCNLALGATGSGFIQMSVDGVTAFNAVAAPGNVNALQASAAAAAAAPILAAVGTDTDIGVRIAPKGAGATQVGGPLTLLNGYAVGSLPSGAIGMITYVTDQVTGCPAKGVAPTAGGAFKCVVFYNGAAWVGI